MTFNQENSWLTTEARRTRRNPEESICKLRNLHVVTVIEIEA